jgi:hypothetical protein
MKNHYLTLNLFKSLLFILLISVSTNFLSAQCSNMFGYSYYDTPNGNIVEGCTPMTFTFVVCNYNSYSVSSNLTVSHGQSAFTYVQMNQFQTCGISNGYQNLCVPTFNLNPYECKTFIFVVQPNTSDLVRVNGYFNIDNGNCDIGLDEITFVPTGVTTIGQTGQTTYLSQVSGTPYRLLVKGNVIFDKNLSIPPEGFIAMDENANITIPNGNLLTLISTNVHGCIRRWNSIIVESGGEIFTRPHVPSYVHNNIRDGENAILAQDDSRINLNWTKFSDNYQGVYAPSIGSYANTLFTNMWECYFQGTGTMLPPAGSSSIVPINTYPYAGMHVENVNSLNISPFFNLITHTLMRTYFENMANGIISKNSNTSILGAVFNNILSQYGNSSNNDIGNGIYSLGTGNWTTLSVTDGSMGRPNEFYNCTNAITTSNNNYINITGNIIYNPYYSNNIGIKLKNHQGFWRINNNNITAAAGITSTNSNMWTYYPLYNNINNNTIYAQGALLGLSGGIICNENLSGSGLNITQNGIQSSTLFGMYLIGVHDSRIIGNESQSSISAGYDIGIGGSNSLTTSCNTTSSTNATNGRIGMTFYNTPYSDISCNTTYSSGYGLYVNGACTNAQLKGNRMSQHNYGLYYGTQTQTGPQSHAGNLWQSGFNTSGAFHAGGVAEAAASPFFVSSSSMPLNPVSVSVPNWFIPQSGTPYACQATQDCPNVYSLVANNPTGEGNPLNDLLTTKANALNVRGSEAVTPEMKWMMQYHLYRHLSDNVDEMVSDNNLKDFYRNASNTSIGKFYKIEKTFKMASDVAKISKKRLEDNTVKHNDLMEQYRKLDTFSFISKRDRDKTVNGQKMNQIRAEMNKITQVNQADLKQIEKEKKAILKGSLQTDIATVGVTLKPEINEKAISEIYLDVLLNDKTTLTESQQRTVTDIANQCPKVGGDAVFKARTLYQMIESKLFIDDDKNCEQEASLVNNDIETIKANVPTKTFGIYPNPARDFIQLQAENLSENGEWLIINAMGKVAVRYQQTKVNADIGDLPMGVYFVSYRSEGVEQFNSKFVKVQ